MKSESIISEPKLNFNYDRTHLCSVQGINPYLQAHDADCKGIDFQGEGWYKGGNMLACCTDEKERYPLKDTLLIVREEGRWRLFVWEGHDPRPMFQQLLALEDCDA